jgi:hypothetical protein
MWRVAMNILDNKSRTAGKGWSSSLEFGRGANKRNLNRVTTQPQNILIVVLHGREILALTLRKEHKLKVFENRVLRRLSRPGRDKVTGK